MKVLSWNVLAHECVMYDEVAEEYPGIPIERLQDHQTRAQRIRSALRRIDADVVLLQEVMPEMKLDECLSATHTAYVSPPLCWAGTPASSCNVTLLRKGSHRIPSNNCQFLSFHDGGAWIVGNIANVHLHDGAPYDGLHHERRDQLMTTLAALKGRPALIGGDWNHELKPLGPLSNSLEQDGFRLATEGNGVTYQIGTDFLRIDHVASRGLLFGPSMVLGTECMDPTQFLCEWGSDHHPVLATFTGLDRDGSKGLGVVTTTQKEEVLNATVQGRDHNTLEEFLATAVRGPPAREHMTRNGRIHSQT